MSKSFTVGALAIGTIAATAAGSYYWGAKKEAASGVEPEIPAATKAEVSGCSAAEVKNTVITLVERKGLITGLLAQASGDKMYVLLKADGDKEAQLSSSSAREEFDEAAVQNREKLKADAISQARISVEAVRTTSIDTTVGSKHCSANLTARMPADWGTAYAEVSYKVERTSDGEDYISILSLGKR